MNEMTERETDPLSVTRRYFLGRGAGVGVGAMALEGLLAGRANASEVISANTVPHFAPKAKRVIFLTQSGGPSQLELYDHKPGLAKLAGEKLPDSVRNGQRLSDMTKGKPQLVMPAHSVFKRRGESGATVSNWLPHIADIADELCFVKSMVTDQINHAPAMTKFLTGHHLTGRPSMGCWFSYGLGSENRDLPDYLVLLSKMKRGSDQPLYDHYWGSGFLPSEYQGVKLRSAKDPVLYLNDPEGLPRELRRGMLNGLNEINSIRQQQTGDLEIAARIQQYEMAYRMQASVPDLVACEPEHLEGGQHVGCCQGSDARVAQAIAP